MSTPAGTAVTYRCGQAALVSVWRLLSLIASGTLFTPRARRRVDGIVAAFGAATIITTLVAFHLLVVARTGGPALAFALMGSIALGAALVLLMVAIRGLLSAATADRSELDEVICRVLQCQPGDILRWEPDDPSPDDPAPPG